jgi:hypothetical protein
MPVYRNASDAVAPGTSFFNLLLLTLESVVKVGELKTITLDDDVPRTAMGHFEGVSAMTMKDTLILMDGVMALGVKIEYTPAKIYNPHEMHGYARFEGYGGLGEIAGAVGNSMENIGDRLRGVAKALVNPNTKPEVKEPAPAVTQEAAWAITVRSAKQPKGFQVTGTVFDDAAIESAFMYIIEQLEAVRKELNARNTPIT